MSLRGVHVIRTTACPDFFYRDGNLIRLSQRDSPKESHRLTELQLKRTSFAMTVFLALSFRNDRYIILQKFYLF